VLPPQVLTLVVVADKKPTTAAKALATVMGEQQPVVGRCRLRLSTLLPNRLTTCLLTLQVGARQGCQLPCPDMP
jgi:hypothetical protein